MAIFGEIAAFLRQHATSVCDVKTADMGALMHCWPQCLEKKRAPYTVNEGGTSAGHHCANKAEVSSLWTALRYCSSFHQQHSSNLESQAMCGSPSTRKKNKQKNKKNSTIIVNSTF